MRLRDKPMEARKSNRRTDGFGIPARHRLVSENRVRNTCFVKTAVKIVILLVNSWSSTVRGIHGALSTPIFCPADGVGPESARF
jgi:hypothetical protein